MPTPTPLLDSLKAEKYAQRDKEAIQRKHPHYKDAAQHPRRTNPKKMAAAASGATPTRRRNKVAIRPHRLANEPQRGLQPPEGVREGRLHDTAEDRKRIRCSTCGQAISIPSPSKGKPWPCDAASINPKHRSRSTSPVQATSTAPSSSRPPTDSSAFITTASAPFLAPASSDVYGRRSRPVLVLASRQFEAAVSGVGVTKGGNKRQRAAEEERELANDGPRSWKREAGGVGRVTTHWHEASLLQLRSLVSYLTPTILRLEAKQAPSHTSHQAPPTDAISGALRLVFVDANF